MKKNVLLVIIDALASRVIQPAMDDGRLPNLRALAETGWIDWRCTAIFPSITPAATAAIVTGAYPTETGVSGAYYYDAGDGNVRYFGDDIWPVLKKGFANFFEEFLVKLNHEHVRVETLYQAVERAGGKAASLNFLWFRGDSPHRAHVPLLLKLWPGVPFSAEVQGPTLLSLGDFVSSRMEPTGQKLHGKHGGMWHRYGFNDENTSEALLRLVRDGPLPNLTVAYFPDNDFESHQHGAEQAVSTVEKVDVVLGEVFSARGGLAKFLKEAAVVVTGDHGQSDLLQGDEETDVPLHELFDDFSVVPAGESWSDHHELLICPNMRAAQIYTRESNCRRRETLINILLADPRVDQVIWREPAEQDVRFHYHVATADRGRLRFWSESSSQSAESAKDAYGARWMWSGELATVDAKVESGKLNFQTYPNAFERIVTAFDAEVSGDIWVTCRLGHEFHSKRTGLHTGGSHGSLHEQDSLSPLIVAGGADAGLSIPPRTVDVAPLCRSLLDLPSKRRVGASHVSPGQSS